MRIHRTKLCPPQTVYNAIKAGYRLFDGAGDYGNEKEAGEGVRQAIKDGLVKREDLCERCTVFFCPPLDCIHL